MAPDVCQRTHTQRQVCERCVALTVQSCPYAAPDGEAMLRMDVEATGVVLLVRSQSRHI